MNTLGDRWGSAQSGYELLLRNLLANDGLLEYVQAAQNTYSLSFTNAARYAIGTLDALSDAEKLQWVLRIERVERGESPEPMIEQSIPWVALIAIGAALYVVMQ